MQFKSIEALSTASKGRILKYENHDLFHRVDMLGDAMVTGGCVHLDLQDWYLTGIWRALEATRDKLSSWGLGAGVIERLIRNDFPNNPKLPVLIRKNFQSRLYAEILKRLTSPSAPETRARRRASRWLLTGDDPPLPGPAGRALLLNRTRLPKLVAPRM